MGTVDRRRRVVIVGAGAAGTMASIFAADAGAETILLESTRDGGRKILVSGGGRCNILPTLLDPSRFITDSSTNSVRKILRSWPLEEQIAFFESEVGIPLAEEPETRKLFPASHRARDVWDGLLNMARRRGVRFLPSSRVTATVPLSGVRWRIDREGAEPLEADAVILATGGLSMPGTGSDGAGFGMVRALGHTVHPLYPALTPILAAGSPFISLTGISLRATVTAVDGARRAEATDAFLFTHRGYSGPAVLDVSHVLVRARAREESGSRPPLPGGRGGGGVRAPSTGMPASGATPSAPTTDSTSIRARLIARWTDLDEEGWVARLQAGGAKTVGEVLGRELPARLAELLLQLAGVNPRISLAHLRREERLRVLERLVRCDLPWSGDEGYPKAEVTGGGVSLAEIDPRTMESRLHPGLHLCGEILDLFGPIGGYNFLWAWVTGRAAGAGAAAAGR